MPGVDSACVRIHKVANVVLNGLGVIWHPLKPAELPL